MDLIKARSLSPQEVDSIRQGIEKRIEDYRLDVEQYREDAKAMENAARIVEDRGDDPMVMLSSLDYTAKHYRREAAEIQGIMTGLRQALMAIEAELITPTPEECFPNLSIADRCKGYLMRKYGEVLPNLKEDYIDEAEHQDGLEYWTQFRSNEHPADWAKLDLEMVLYALNKGE